MPSAPKIRYLLRFIRFVLAPRWVGVTLIAIAFVSGLSTVTLIYLRQADLLPADSQASEEVSEVEDPDESAEIDPGGLDLENLNAGAIPFAPDAPEALQSDFVRDPFVDTVLGPVGLLDPEAPVQMVYDKDAVLADHDDRVNKDFHIPPGLRDRVAFWFDVYTKFDSNKRIIHHSMYPWIVYKIVDTSFIIESDQPRRLWMRREKADRVVKAEEKRITAMLRKIGRMRHIEKLNSDERAVAVQLLALGGDLRRQARLAANKVRVQTGQKNFFTDGLQISSRFLPNMEKIFIERRLPIELTRIPFVESSFNKTATSKVGAAGIWQFMDSTGRKFMLVNTAIDERRSPLKATEAAARLLKETHMILYRSWPLAVTAWNHGPSGVRRATQHVGSRDLAKVVRDYHSRTFDFASANFFSEFLAALHAERYSDEIFGPLEHAPSVDLQMVQLARAVRFKTLLQMSGLSLENFLLTNPDLAIVARRNLLVPRGFRLHLPVSVLGNLEQVLAQLRPRRGSHET